MNDRTSNARRPTRDEFERLVREHHAAVYHSALRIANDAALAEDVTQQVYLALLEGRLDLEGPAEERVLRWYAARTALSVMRGERHRREREGSRAMEHEDHVVDHDPLARAEESTQLRRCIGTLPAELRAAIHLRFDEEMTYAAIAGALAISEPTAHERVAKALEKLREKLGRVGLSAVALDVEGRLTRLARGPAQPAPAHLAPKLNALHGAALAASTGTAAVPISAWLVALVSIAAGAGLWAALAHSGAGDARTETASVASVARGESTPSATAARDQDVDPSNAAPGTSTLRSPERTPLASALAIASATATPVAVEFTGTIVGQVVDEHDVAVEDLEVAAYSVVHDGKFAKHSASARTGPDGRFRIVVPIESSDGQNYRLGAVDPLANRALERAGDRVVRALPDREVTAEVLRAQRGTLDAPGEYTLTITLRDESGAAVAGVPVRLYRDAGEVLAYSPSTWEAGNLSDSGGIVRLAGSRVGPKRLLVDGRDHGWRRVRREIVLQGGSHAETIVLARGLTISGTLHDAEGHVVASTDAHGRLQDLQMHAWSGDTNEWWIAAIDASGAFRFEGLDAADYSIELQLGRWSPICLDGVRAGTQDLALVLKPAIDTRDIGQHCSEIHGMLIDAETRQRLTVDATEDTDVVALPAGITPAEFEADWKPDLLWPRPVQRGMFGEPPPASAGFRATGLKAGAYAVVIRPGGWAPGFAGPIELAPHQIVRDVSIVLEKPRKVVGRVLDRDGRPLANAFVMITGRGSHSNVALAEVDREVRETDGKPRGWMGGHVTADADGRFEIDGVPPDLEFVLVALHAHREPITSQVLRASDDTPVDLRFERAR